MAIQCPFLALALRIARVCRHPFSLMLSTGKAVLARELSTYPIKTPFGSLCVSQVSHIINQMAAALAVI